jgi:hypothetical protein
LLSGAIVLLPHLQHVGEQSWLDEHDSPLPL